MKARLGVLLILLFNMAFINAAQFVAGDLAPRSASNNTLDVADVFILQQFVNGLETPTATELQIADVAPVGNPDGELNVADVMIVQRVLQGLITLTPVTVLPPVPTLNAVTSPSSENPFNISGTASPSVPVNIYHNGQLLKTINSEADGAFQTTVVLSLGSNTIVATEFDGVDESPNSNLLTVVFELKEGGNLLGDISGVTLLANTRYTVTQEITVNNSANLIIEQGARLAFSANTKLIINGSANIVGLPGIPIIFTSGSATPTNGDWPGIEISGGVPNRIIDNVIIEYAVVGIKFTNTRTNGVADVTLQNSILRNNIDAIDVYKSSTPLIINNQIYDNNRGFYIHGYNAGSYNTYPVINDNQIYNNKINLRSDSMFNNNESPMLVDAKNNWWGSPDAIAVNDSIYDYNDTNDARSNPMIDFSGFLDAPDGVSQGDLLLPFERTDKTFNSGTVHVFNNVLIKPGFSPPTVIVTFDAGARVIVYGDYEIKVGSQTSALQVLGNTANPVRFSSGQAFPQPGDWGGIILPLSTLSSHLIDNAIIEHAKVGVFFDNTNTNSVIDGGTISNSILRNNIDAIEVYGTSSPIINNNKIYNNKRGVFVRGVAASAYVAQSIKLYPKINNNEIYGNTDWNLYTEDMNDVNVVTVTWPMLIDAKNNWWGSADPLQISETIYDYYDSGIIDRNPVIDFGNALDSAAGLPQELYVYETFNTDQTISNRAVFYGVNTVDAAATLTFESGTELQFYQNSQLLVNGGLTAVGSASTPVIFTPLETTGDNNYWKGIKFIGVDESTINTGANINNCLITGADRAFEFENADGLIQNCTITQNNIGVYVYKNSGPAFTNNSIINNATGIFFDGNNVAVGFEPHPTFNSNNIYDNTLNNIDAIGIADDFNGVVFTNNWWNTTDTTAIRATFGSGVTTTGVPLDSVATTSQNLLSPSSFSVSDAFISPSVSVGSKDTTTISASFSASANWQIQIFNSAGVLINSLSGIGTSAAYSWNGTNQSGTPQADGRYQVRVTNNGNPVMVSHAVIDNTLPVSNIDDALNGITQNVVQLPINGSLHDVNLSTYVLEVADSAAPTNFKLIDSGNRRVTTNLIYNWVVNNPNINVEPTGGKILRLTVTDKAGNTSVDTSTFTLSHLSIRNVSYLPATSIQPLNGETLDVTFTLDNLASVSLNIYEEYTAVSTDTGTLVASVTANYTTTGEKTLSWDGRNSAGNYVKNEAYRFELLADNGVITSLYSLQGNIGIPNQLAPRSYNKATFDPYANDYLHYSTGPPFTDAPRRYTFRGNYGNIFEVVLQKIFLPGSSYDFFWDQRTNAGQLVNTGSTIGVSMRYLKPNSIIVSGTSPQLLGTQAAPHVEIKSDPYRINHSFDQVTKVDFTVDQDVILSVKLIRPCLIGDDTCTADFDSPTAISIINNETRTALDGLGQPIIQSFEWRGYNYTDANPDTNNPLVDEVGVYTYIIKAVSIASGVETQYRGSLQIFR